MTVGEPMAQARKAGCSQPPGYLCLNFNGHAIFNVASELRDLDGSLTSCRLGSLRLPRSIE